MTITCGIQPTGVVTIAMKVLHNNCKLYFHELLDMNALSVMRWAYIQANPSCPCCNHYCSTLKV